MTEWVNPNKHASNAEIVKHTDKTCQYVTPESVPAEEAPVNAEELRVCDYCADRIHGRQNEPDPCPFCGDDVKTLPDHLPCEASP